MNTKVTLIRKANTDSAMDTMLICPLNQPLTSTKRSAVNVIKIQEIKKRKREGKNPESPAKIGRANIPAPIQLPEINNIPPKTLPEIRCFFKDVLSYSLLLRNISYSS